MLRRLTAIAAATAVASAGIVFSASPASARACRIDWYCYHTFYSDAEHTTAVGGIATSCDGTMSQWGTRSSYQTFDEYPCDW